MIPTQQGDISSTLAEQFETKNFEVALTSKTFSVLFDTLYQDKIGSPMRELCTNAYDSHVAAGKHFPFKVQLPTSLDPTFSVRDYGTGLSKADIMGLYTTALATTKDRTNDQVGYLGLGSKSFFAYTDSAMVTSWYNGEQSNYICSLDAQRIPQISHVSSVPSTQPNGLKISYSVKPQDVVAFSNAASKVLEGYRGYDIHPIFNKDVKVAMEEVVYETDEILISRGGVGYLRIRQGCVIYPVNQRDLIDWLNYGYSVTITVPIGTVEVAASREYLSLDDRTSQRVKDIASAAIIKLDREIEDILSTSSSYIEACCSFFNNIARWRRPQSLPNLTRQGKELKGYISFPNSIPGPPLETTLNDGTIIQTLPTKVPIVLQTGFGQNTRVYGINVNEIKNLKIATIAPGEKVLRQRDRFNESDFTHIIRGFTEEIKEALVEALELKDDQFIPLSTTYDPGPKPTIIGRTKDVNGHSKVMPYIVRGRNSWNQRELPDDDNYYWLPADKKYGRITIGGRGYSPLDYETSAMKHLKNLVTIFPGIPSEPYVMTATMQKKAGVKQNNRLDIAIQQYIKDNEKNIFNLLLLDHLRCSMPRHLKEIEGISFGIKLPHGWETTRSPRSPGPTNASLEFFNPGDTKNRQDKLQAAIKCTSERYPMLFSPNFEDIEEYIMFVNKKRKRK